MGFNGPKLLSIKLGSSVKASEHAASQAGSGITSDQIMTGKFGRFRFAPGAVTNFESSRIDAPATDTLATTLEGPIEAPKVGSKVRSSSQLCTGSIAIDLTQSIGEGSFVIFNGKKGSGRTTVVQNTINSFLDSSDQTSVVFVGLNTTEVKSVLSGIENKDRCIMVCPDASASEASVFINTEAAVRTAIDLKNQGRRVLCIVSELNLVLSAGLTVAKDLGTYYLPRNFLYPLMDHSYSFRDGSSLTTILVSEEPALESPHFMSLLQYHNLIKSASKNIIQFGTSNSVPVGSDLQLLPSPYGYQTPYIRALSRQLFALLLKLRDQKKEIAQFKSLGLHVDPWDHYLYHDSTYFSKLLLHKKPLNLLQQTLVTHFVLRSIETDIVGYLQAHPESLIADLIDAAHKPLPSGVSVLDTLKLAQHEEDVTQVDTLLNAFFDIFFEQQRTEGKLRTDKNDYL